MRSYNNTTVNALARLPIIRFQISRGDYFLITAVAFVYTPSLYSGFLWDSEAVTDNVLLHSIGGLIQIWNPATPIPYETHYWPLTYTFFWFEYQMFGDSPFGYHLTNIFLHVANALLFHRLLLILRFPEARLAAFIFAIHPIQVESVAWIIERKNVLSLFFLLVSVILYFGRVGGNGYQRLLLSWFFFLLAVLSKSMVTPAPIIILALRYWQRGLLRRLDYLESLPLFAIGLVSSFSTVFHSQSYERMGWFLSIYERVTVVGKAMAFYIYKFILPCNLLMIYPKWDVSAFGWLDLFYPLVILSALVWGGWRFLCHSSGTGLLILIYMVSLAPVCGVTDFGYMDRSFVANRFAYLATTALSVSLALAISRSSKVMCGTIKKHSPIEIIVIGGLCVLTWTEAYLYLNPVKLWQRTVDRNPTSMVALVNLSNALLVENRLSEAAEVLDQCLRYYPSNSYALSNKGWLEHLLGNDDLAIKYTKESLETDPSNWKACYNLGLFFQEKGMDGTARRYFNRAAGMKPFAAGAYRELSSQGGGLE